MALEKRVKELEIRVDDISRLIEAEKRSILTPAQAAAYLQIPEESVIEMCDGRELPCARIAGEYRLPKWLLEEWLERVSYDKRKSKTSA